MKCGTGSLLETYRKGSPKRLRHPLADQLYQFRTFAALNNRRTDMSMCGFQRAWTRLAHSVTASHSSGESSYGIKPDQVEVSDHDTFSPYPKGSPAHLHANLAVTQLPGGRSVARSIASWIPSSFLRASSAP